MTLTDFAAHDFATASYGEPVFDGFADFHFWHRCSLQYFWFLAHLPEGFR